MCGIIGFTGTGDARGIILDGLKRLEYRGYDSAGIAVQNGNEINMVKAQGKVDNLIALAEKNDKLIGHCGIGHTRWATHGVPNDVNAHPHMSEDGKFAIVHNGIIENQAELKEKLIKKGMKFKSDTDTEVMVQLLSYNYKGDLKQALMKTISEINGSYGIGVLCADNPGVIYTAKVASPIVIGIGVGENYFGSDITAFINHTKNVIDLDDNELAEVHKDKVIVYDYKGDVIKKDIRKVTWDIAAAEKSGYEHFMLKEIMEQPAAIKATIEPRIKDDKINFEELNIDISKFDRVLITACGSAYYAGCVGRMVIEKLCRLHVSAEVASELRYSDPMIDEKTLVIAVSQSGETADTIAAMKEAKSKGATVLAIVNVVGSTIAKLADFAIYTWAGPEIAVATTKGYTTQVAVFYMFAVWAAKELKKIDDKKYAEYISDIKRIPERAQRTLDLNTKVKTLADKYYHNKSIFFIGRYIDYAVCLEGSLKLKEISYIHSEAYAAGELKHGTIALIEEGRLVVAVCCYEPLLDKIISNIQQVKARGAEVLALAMEDNKKIFNEADDVLLVPKTSEMFMPIIEIIPLQLFAYYVAKNNKCDIDKPKNLAKSVTVE